MRYFVSFLALALMLSAGIPTAQAQSTTETSAQIETRIEAKIADLLSQVEMLRAKLKLHQTGSSSDALQMAKVKINTHLNQGARGEQVRLLQQLLASDPALYPEGLVTGYYGTATAEAVKRFQLRLKLEQVGAVGPMTISRINEILAAAGVTSEIPSDLLRERIKIKFEMKNGREEIKFEVKGDNSGSDGDDEDEDEDEDDEDDEDVDEDEDDEELEIAVDIKNGRAKVKVERDGDKRRFILGLTDRSKIIERLAELLELSKSEVEAVIEIEGEDEDEDEDED